MPRSRWRLSGTSKERAVFNQHAQAVNRGDYDIDIIMRLYAPDLERFESWTAPKAKMIQ